ncbi:MAG TPA: hypothetical protein PK452_18075 [Amaricoccus sp.]|uniref:hypothetical protein n=2 Tax=Amaricoccus TaxID=56999 RepID=UPI002C252286|nr:hypothetical protein [Amaricoccus sp.]HRO13436.1 hypothetical protein [Amaricoccus sp.]
MNARLKDVMGEAETKLAPEAQERLVEIIESFVASWGTGGNFSADEMARLREIDAEPFEAAGPAEVGEFFRQRG